MIGTGSARNKKVGHMVFAMHVARTVTFTEYWNAPEFLSKRPNLRGSVKQGYGDNIYHKAGAQFLQADSHHSYEDGSPNQHNIDNDTQTDRVLIAEQFVYWGGGGPLIPNEFRETPDICAIRGHKCHFPDEFVTGFLEWLVGIDEWGCPGRPLDWDKM